MRGQISRSRRGTATHGGGLSTLIRDHFSKGHVGLNVPFNYPGVNGLAQSPDFK
jgi:hypothetical protein